MAESFVPVNRFVMYIIADLLALESGHICRILSDVVSLACFSLHFSNVGINSALKMDSALQVIFNRMHESTVDVGSGPIKSLAGMTIG